MKADGRDIAIGKKLQLLISSTRFNEDAVSQELISEIRKIPVLKDDERNSVIYYDYPIYTDYENRDYRADFCLLTALGGFFAIKVLDGAVAGSHQSDLAQADDDLVEFCGLVTSKLIKSRILKKGVSSLKFDINPIIFYNGPSKLDSSEIQSSVVTSVGSLIELITNSSDELSEDVFQETRSIIEGAKAITRPPAKVPEPDKLSERLKTVHDIERQIVNFDARQREVALSMVPGPHRIRGLAGSGKTVILCMKAALLHAYDPTAPILVTFFTRSLHSTIKNMIGRFYRHLRDEDPNWSVVHIRHGWGGKSVPGVYSDASRRAGMLPLTLGEAKAAVRDWREDAFAAACRILNESGKVQPFYRYVFVDEGQDFPDQFYRLIYNIVTGVGDEKSIVWAYDELQNILNVKIRTTEELFGVDIHGQPLISLDRAANKLPFNVVNDSILKKCYRNQGAVLVAAHALGFGIYSKQIVQLLEDPSHWQDVGYIVETGGQKPGETTVIVRPPENSPTSVSAPNALITSFVAANAAEEIEKAVEQIQALLNDGLPAEEIMVVCLDDRYVKTYLDAMALRLGKLGVGVNHLLADKYTQPPFRIEGRVTLTTIYRAKGNEAYQVFIVGSDALRLKSRGDRNKIFTALTRSKAWVSISGVGENAALLEKEIETAIGNFPYLKFVMPDLKEVEFIQRDLSNRAAKAKEAREAYLAQLEELGLTEAEADELNHERKIDTKGL